MKRSDNAIILRALSLLLSYPDETMRGHLPAVRAALNADRRIPSARKAASG